MTATGDPVVPEPEKSFLQKYWHFIAIALLALGALTLLISLGHPSSPTRVSNCPRWRRSSARIVNPLVIVTVLCSIIARAYATQFALRGRGSPVYHLCLVTCFFVNPISDKNPRFLM